MLLLVILICLALQKLANIFIDVNEIWAEPYLHWLEPWFHKFKLSKLGAWPNLVILLLPPLLLVAVVHLLLMHVFFGLFYLLFVAIVVFLLLDARDLKALLKDYFKMVDSGDRAKAAALAGAFFNVAINANSGLMERTVTVQILERCYRKILAPLFWFVVLGVYGLVGYCLLTRIERFQRDEYKLVAQAAATVRKILDWLPLRLSALSFALAGRFSAGFQYLYKKLFTLSCSVQEIGINAGLVAMGAKVDVTDSGNLQENNLALTMVDRVLIIWLVALAIFVLGSFF